MSDYDWKPATVAVRSGTVRTDEQEHSPAIFATSSFVFGSAAEAAAKFAGERPGNIYSRFTNPTVRGFEERLAALESADWAIGTGSGMSAVLCACMGVLQAGDHLVASRSVFGTINALFEQFLPRFGVDMTYVDLTDVDQWRAAIRPTTKMLFLETPSNPLMQLADVTELAELAHANDALLTVDSTICTPILMQPLALGADLAVHSATKYIDGQGRAIGGAVLGRNKELHEQIMKFHRTCGTALSPFNAWVFVKGLETLALRVNAECANANRLAAWLQTQPGVERVYHPSLPDHPQHELAKRQQRDFGTVVSFDVRGGKDAAWKIIDSTRMLSITANLGDTRTTITHPATTTHGKTSPEGRAAAGITDGLVRIACGVEDFDDITADLARGLPS